MAVVKLEFGINQELRRGTSARLWGEVCRLGLKKAIALWHRKILPRHFDPDAPRRYPEAYTPRTKRHEGRKISKNMGARQPMVFTGAMRREILGRKPQIINYKTPTSAKVKAKLFIHAEGMRYNAPSRYVHTTGVVHDFRRELQAFNDKDRGLLRKLAERVIARELARRFEQAPMVMTRMAA